MSRVIEFVKKLHRNEDGAEGLEKLLIIAAVALPLLGILIFFREWITDWVSTEAETVQGNSGVTDPFGGGAP